MGKLDDFTLAYIACALWCSNDDSTPSGGDPLGEEIFHCGRCARNPEEDGERLRRLQRANEALLGASGLGAELAGHDFWLTRNRHGSGFWDEDIGDVGCKLSETASSYGECNLYIGDDKRIYGV